MFNETDTISGDLEIRHIRKSSKERNGSESKSSSSSSNESIFPTLRKVPLISKSNLPLPLPEIPKFKPAESKQGFIDYGLRVPPIPPFDPRHKTLVLEGKSFRLFGEVDQKMHAVENPPYEPRSKGHRERLPLLTSENNASGAYSIQRFGLVWKIPASTCNELLTLMHDSSTKSSSYVYSFGFDPNLHSSLPVSFEFYRNRASEFVNIRVSTETGFTKGDAATLSFSDKSSGLTVSVVDDDGLIVRGEKWAPGYEIANHGIKFEIEDFISKTGISELLETYGALNLLMSFEGCEIEFPKTENPTRTHEHATGDDCPLPTLTVVTDFFENNFHHFVVQKGFNSFLGAQTQNDRFADAVVKVYYEGEVIDIPVHRVFLAAQSKLLASLLDGSDVLLIEGFEFPCINTMLEFAYSGEVLTEDMELLTKLLKLSEAFHMDALKEKCIQIIHRSYLCHHDLCKEPFTEYFKTGEQLQSPIFIKMAAAEFARWKAVSFQSGEGNWVPDSSDLENYDAEISEIKAKLEKLSLHLSASENETKLKPKAADDVELLGTFTETWIGLIYTVPGAVSDKLWNKLNNDDESTEPSPSTSASASASEPDSNGIEIYYDFALDLNTNYNYATTDDEDDRPTGIVQIFKDAKNINEVCLKVVTYDDDELLIPSDEDYETDPDGNTEDNIGLTLLASLYDNTGRIVHECRTRSFLKSDYERIWEIKPFFSTLDFEITDLVDDAGLLMLRIGIGCIRGLPIVSPLNPVTEETEYGEIVKYDVEYFDKVMLNPFNHRLLAQLGSSTFSDAMLRVIGENEEHLFSIPIHRIIVAAFCPILGAELETSNEIRLLQKDYSVNCIQAVLNYMYSNFVPKMNLDLGLELLCFAKELGIVGLWDYTLDRMLRLPLTFESAFVFYKFGLSINSDPVKTAASKYLKRNKESIMNSEEYPAFVQEYPELASYLH